MRLSLREVTREAGIVPAAFYRHFESMEALGLVLIDESFRTLRDMLRGARAGKLDPNRVIESSVEIVVASVTEGREHWRFIGRERSSGVTVLRYAIRTEFRLLTSELATDLARFPGLNDWSTDDLNVLASLFVNSMIVIAEATRRRPGRRGDRRDPSYRGQAAADDRDRRQRLAQQPLTLSACPDFRRSLSVSRRPFVGRAAKGLAASRLRRRIPHRAQR